MRSPPRVAVLIETSTSWGGQAVRGIVDYAKSSGRWSLMVDWRGVHEQLRLPHDWRGDGIIARVTTRQLASQIEALSVPAVNVSWSDIPGLRFPKVTSDEQAIGRLAAEHFVERGFRHFAYFGQAGQPNYVDRCGPTFAASVSAHGYHCVSFHAARVATMSRSRDPWLECIRRWLSTLPKPVGVFAWDAVHGRQLTEACWKSGIRVPEDVAVIAGYNDDLMCEISMPPLSAIDQRPDQIGYTAAKVLDGLLHGRKSTAEPTYIEPLGIVTRRSTDTLAHDDPDLVAAVRFIHEHATDPISVKDILDAVPVSRRSLEKRFLKDLGRTPAAEIRRARLQRAKELLAHTDLPVPRVASASGFLHSEVMTRMFRRELGVSPTAYRRRTRHT